MKVQAVVGYSDSMSDPLKYKGGLGYHPLEALDYFEKNHEGELTLTDAEIARTVVEVSNNATLIFSGIVDNEVHENIVWPDLQYVTDGHGRPAASSVDQFRSNSNSSNPKQNSYMGPYKIPASLLTQKPVHPSDHENRESSTTRSKQTRYRKSTS